MARAHTYEVSVAWTGNRGTGTSGYRAYGRDHDVRAPGLPPIDRQLGQLPVRHEPVVTAGASDTVRYAAPHQGHRSDP